MCVHTGPARPIGVSYFDLFLILTSILLFLTKYETREKKRDLPESPAASRDVYQAVQCSSSGFVILLVNEIAYFVSYSKSPILFEIYFHIQVSILLKTRLQARCSLCTPMCAVGTAIRRLLIVSGAPPEMYTESTQASRRAAASTGT